jgi:hypothetical protein
VRVWFCNRRQTERKLQHLAANPAATLASLEEANNGFGEGVNQCKNYLSNYNTDLLS